MNKHQFVTREEEENQGEKFKITNRQTTICIDAYKNVGIIHVPKFNLGIFTDC